MLRSSGGPLLQRVGGAHVAQLQDARTAVERSTLPAERDAATGIGEHAHITGGVVAEDIVILGHVMGSVRGVRVSLQSTSHVEGDVRHEALVMEQGAFFEGKSTRSDDPLADPPASELGALNGFGEA